MHTLTHKHKSIHTHMHTCPSACIVRTYAQTGFILGKESIFKDVLSLSKHIVRMLRGRKIKCRDHPSSVRAGRFLKTFYHQ